MSFTAISSSYIAAKKAVVHQLWLLAKQNFEDHSARLNALEGNSVAAETGVILYYGNAAPPSGWLLCDGSVVSQATYAALFAVVSTNFNTSGEGAGDFRLPNLLGRCGIGRGTGSGLTARTIGTKLGKETHLLITAELPVHNHTLTDPGHLHAGLKKILASGGASLSFRTSLGPGATVTFETDKNTTGITFANYGSGGAHNNMQPYAVGGAAIIKT